MKINPFNSFVGVVSLVLWVECTAAFLSKTSIATNTHPRLTGPANAHAKPCQAKSSATFSSAYLSSQTARSAASLTNGDGRDKQETYDETCDVLVLGSGPAGRAIASLLSSPKVGMDVIVADTNFDKEWPPNYGVWTNEWNDIMEAYKEFGVELKGGNEGSCIDREWQVTDCYFGGSFDIPMEQRLRLDRPYRRVDRSALRKSLSPDTYKVLNAKHFSEAINVNMYSPAGSLVHDDKGSTIQLEKADGEIITVRSKLVVDSTGHETKLVMRDTRDPYTSPGFQIAYGCLVEVDETNSPDLTHIGPYDKEAMTLFDYRTDHFDSSDDALMDKVERAPTFMYAMPLKDNKIFFEETSLVARPALSLQECKERCQTRLKHLGIKVKEVEEEEFCYIPMGGALPVRDQRILGIGGSAVMVHPSTGYHLCRCMMGATAMANAIQKEMSIDNPNLDRVAASAYHALWSPENVRQRNFAVFGGEFLMKQNVKGLRGFFDGFFKLPMELWGGFLAGWPGLTWNENHETWYARMWFGLNFIVRLPPIVALDMAVSIAAYTLREGVPLPQSVTPFLGEPKSYEYERNKDTIGDIAVKEEARRMIMESKVTEDIPSAFEPNAQSISPQTTEKKTDKTVLSSLNNIEEKAEEQATAV